MRLLAAFVWDQEEDFCGGRVEGMWRKSGESVEEEWRECGGYMDLN